jgi:hypothetical protein
MTELAQAATLPTFILEMSDSNLGQNANYLAEFFFMIFLSPGKCQDSTLN